MNYIEYLLGKQFPQSKLIKAQTGFKSPDPKKLKYLKELVARKNNGYFGDGYDDILNPQVEMGQHEYFPEPSSPEEAKYLYNKYITPNLLYNTTSSYFSENSDHTRARNYLSDLFPSYLGSSDAEIKAFIERQKTITDKDLIEYANGGFISKLNLPKAQTGLQQLEGFIDSWLGYPQVQARKIAVNAGIRGGGKDDEFADSVRHANAGRLTAAQLQSKMSNYVPNFVSAPLAFLGANALGASHELSTLLGDKRPWSEKLREAGEDIYNNSYGAKLGALGDPKGQEKIEDAWINNRLPDGQVWTNNSGNGYMMSNGAKGFYKDADKKTQLNLSAKRKLENLNQVQRDGTFIKPKLKTGGCLPKYQTAGKTNKKDKVNQDDKKPVYSWNSFIISNANVVTPKEIGTSVTTDSKAAIKYNENRKIREAQERKDRIAAANAMQKSGKQFDSTENYAIANSAIGDKLRFSAEPNIVDDYLNPAAMIGDMASGLATVPDNLKKGNYGQAALAVAAPLATGALAGIGAKNTIQFVDNLVNPFAGLIKYKKINNSQINKNVSDNIINPSVEFKSEIDWSKWNPDTPKYPELINEYNAIEESTKKAGTWMKNPDGSAFQGTPEQFIQQQSSYFKKAFGESKLIGPEGSPMFLYHGSAKKFDTFDPSKFQLGDAGYSGAGIYTTPSKTTANSYATSSAKFHSGDIEPTVYQLYGQGNRPIKSSDLIKENQGRDLFNFYRDKNWKGELSPYESLREYDVAVSDQLPNVQNIRPLHDAREIVFPRNTQLKSAVGNVGFFDMTNPNIFKNIASTGLTGAGLLKAMQSINKDEKKPQMSKGGILNKKSDWEIIE